MRILKRFSFWMVENGYAPNIRLDKLKKIKMPPDGTRTKTSEQMFTEAEVKLMIESCQISRDRADIIIDACAYYCQFHDMHSEQFPETMRSIFYRE
ncbi:MAG: hypothetical protein WC626_09470 [Methanoregula sp.]